MIIRLSVLIQWNRTPKRKTKLRSIPRKPERSISKAVTRTICIQPLNQENRQRL